MALPEYAARARRVIDWLEELDDVVTVAPEIQDDDVVFHLNITRVSDWREQTAAIVKTGTGWEPSPVSNFVVLEGEVDGIGEVSLFVPRYDDLDPTQFPAVDYAALVAEAQA